VIISNSFAPIRISGVEGELRVSGRNGSVEVEHAASDVNVETSFNNVSIRAAKGSVAVANRNGDVLIRLLQPPPKAVSASTEFSNVTVELPGGSSFNVEARTRFGQIRSGFDGLTATSNERERSLNGRVGQGGPNIKLDTRNGDITLRRF